jgi:hypothetical protein
MRMQAFAVIELASTTATGKILLLDNPDDPVIGQRAEVLLVANPYPALRVVDIPTAVLLIQRSM